MSALRLLSSAARRTPSVFRQQQRGYAEAAGKISLSLVLPHQVCRTTQNYIAFALIMLTSPSSPQRMLSR